VKLQKDTVLSLVKGATVFINYLGACIFYVDLLFADAVLAAATYVRIIVLRCSM
jgi:hypothetical protein